MRAEQQPRNSRPSAPMLQGEMLSLVPDVRALACVGVANINDPGASGAAPPGESLFDGD